jgi:hypothetical protein
MPATATVAALLATAEDLLTESPDGDGPMTPAGRDRGAAYVLRIALEAAVDAALASRAASLREVSMRAKLLVCVTTPALTRPRRANALWNRLSAACNYHHDELGPTHAQVRTWYAAARALVAELSAPGAGIEFPQQKSTRRPRGGGGGSWR